MKGVVIPEPFSVEQPQKKRKVASILKINGSKKLATNPLPRRLKRMIVEKYDISVGNNDEDTKTEDLIQGKSSQ